MCKAIYFDCASGISGDMIVSSLVDLGVRPEVIEEGLASLGIDGFETVFSNVIKNGQPATDFDVILIDNEKQEYRGLDEVLEIIERSGLAEGVKNRASRIFKEAAAGWAEAHGTSINEVTFHERGAIDSIVDIVSASICFEELGAEKVFFSPITEGSGRIAYRFGTLPVPVPAVKSIVSRAGHLELTPTDINGEMVTPTGAAIAACMSSEKFGEREHVHLACGYGAGKTEGLGRGYLKAELIDIAQ